MADSLVRYEQADSVAIVTMDDGKVNALSPALIAELETTFDRAEKQAKAVVLTGRKDRFSAGFDLRVLMSGPKPATELLTAGGALFLRLYELSKPLVIACTGHALAGGVLLAATGDTRIGARGDYKLGLNEVQKGMPVPTLAFELARDRLDPREITASVVQAKIYNPDEAASAGWLDRVVDEAELADAALAEAKRLAQMPGGAYGMSKKSLRAGTIERIRSGFAKEIAQLGG